ncbi:carboxyvinyl-carboxyphosphonate phosphorylmutase, partial [Streptomyces subrutilus]
TVGTKPLLFNQIAGGKSPRLSLGELTDLGVDVAIYSTPCLFAAHRAMDTALAELHLADGRLPANESGEEIGVGESTRLLAKNIARHHALPGARDSKSVTV